ncbi:hypothetical protein SAMN05421512_10158 [Stappia indica]|uniref:N-acetyltransferase domain-containing protein n=1 Tax=Stappia indica TaxID=538381 RepID=A0A285R4X3_9HYPH|nr:hypothetical protein SAMN05421512_10158 [Stappia indica]
MDILSGYDAVSKMKASILSAGCGSLEVGYEISDFERICQSFPKGRLGEHFSRRLNTLPPNRLIWIVAKDRAGRPVAAAAARFDDIKGWDLERFISEYWTRIYTDENGDPIEIIPMSLEHARGISGPWVYLGEGFVAEDFRGKKISSNLIRILIILAFNEFRPNLLYGWMRPPLIKIGVNTNWGFHNTIYPGLLWKKAPHQLDLHDLAFVSCDARGVGRLSQRFSGSSLE